MIKSKYMYKGIVRKIDPLGRLCIPKEMLRVLKITSDVLVEIYLYKGIICLKVFNEQCSGITRYIDKLGRIVLPKEMFYTLGIENGDEMDIYMDNNVLCMKSANVEECECIFCNEDDFNELILIKNIPVCQTCLITESNKLKEHLERAQAILKG